jgi:hypothetical protein
MWSLTFYIVHNNTFGIALIQNHEPSLINKHLIKLLFKAMNSDHVVNDLILEGIE